MMHDPFQTYSQWGAYPGINPLITGISPFAHQQGLPGVAGLQGIAGYGGLNPQQLQQQLQQQQLQQLQQQQLQQLQQLQLAALLASQAGNPQGFGLTPLTQGLHNPLATIGLQNPMLSQGLQNPLLNPIVAQYYQTQYPQLGFGGVSPFTQGGSIFGQGGYPLAPQSWIGQQGMGVGSPFGQSHPLLSQFGRGLQGHGISPWSAI